MKMIEIKNLVFEYIRRDEDGNVDGVERAIDGLSLDVKAGDFIAIIGHNGSGKSTLAKHLNALLVPSEGSVVVNGFNTKEEEKVWNIRQSAGMVFQNPDNQIIASVVEEDVAFGPENMGIEPKEIKERVDMGLRAVGMEGYRHHSPNRLSGGQKQRVAIAGIMAMKPRCIIFDEPTAMLDPVGRKEVIKTAHELNKRDGITVILITHYMNEVTKADKVFVMDQGRLVMSGTPREVFREVEKLESLHLDVPQVTKLAHELKKEGFPFRDAILTVEEFSAAIKEMNL